MTVRGERGPKRLPVDGWSNGTFGIDVRTKRYGRGKVWCVTHLGTGYAACYLVGSLKTVQAIADELVRAADWNFTAPDEARSQGRGDAAMKLKERWPKAFISSFEAGPPVPAQGTSASGRDPQGHEAKPAGPVAEGHAP